MFDYLKTNWKTTAAGAAMLVTIGIRWVATGVAPTFDDALAVFGAFGLLAAKDINVTGGDKAQ